MRQINEAGLALLKRFEVLKLQAYDDGGGVWTIGWGHTGPDVVPGLQIDEQRAEELIHEDLADAYGAVENLVTTQLTDNQFSALVIFAFNIGTGGFKHSTMLKLLNANDFGQAANEFSKWIHQGAKILGGLVMRREAEKELFLS